MTAPLVRAEAVEVLVGSARALPPTDLEVRSGEVVVVHGPSGSGKTTLLGLLAGWLEPTAGSLTWSAPLDGDDRWRWHRVAVVPQSLGLLPELSLLENVAIAHRLAGAPGDISAAAALDAHDAVGVAELADRRPVEASLGQQQRAAVARALTQSPPLVLADEPTSHLDEKAALLVLDALAAVAAAGSAIVVASHDPVVLDRADRSVALG